ncbi:MAG: exodeoxyribonuclease VII small subunit [Saccharofermentans sp.]|nr:exodeoxyribonuclease VII small subunit [Saccharofermentans sp.]
MMEEGFVYESAVKELQDIVNKLGSGNVSLDDSLKLYTRGIELSSLCDEKLKEIEQKVSIVNPVTKEESDEIDV